MRKNWHSSPVLYNDLLGDSIRLTNAFKANKDMMNAYNTWIKTAAGKKFLKNYDVGGKYYHVAMVFDAESMYDMGADGEADVSLVNVSNNKDELTAFSNDDEKVKENMINFKEALEGKSKTHYLKYTIKLRQQYSDNDEPGKSMSIAGYIGTLNHERQHLQLTQKYLIGENRIISRYEQHDLMRSGALYWERYNNYLEQIKLWYPFYNKFKNTMYKGQSITNFIDKEINDYQR